MHLIASVSTFKKPDLVLAHTQSPLSRALKGKERQLAFKPSLINTFLRVPKFSCSINSFFCFLSLSFIYCFSRIRSTLHSHSPSPNKTPLMFPFILFIPADPWPHSEENFPHKKIHYQDIGVQGSLQWDGLICPSLCRFSIHYGLNLCLILTPLKMIVQGNRAMNINNNSHLN